MLVFSAILRSFLKSFHAKKLLATLSALVVVAGMLLGARVAVADSVWVQSYQRASSSEACVAQAGETPWQAAWGSDPSWSPSWEQWANKGTGGWVCTRIITWAGSAADSAGSSVTYTCSNLGVRSPGGGTCALGDTGPGGGKVFYVDMARAAGSQFWEVGSALGSAAWGCNGILIGGTLTGIGTGEANTAAIITGCAEAGIAARVASAPTPGFSDWFLPSKDELNQLCKYARAQSTAVADQAVICNTTGTLSSEFAGTAYWSSSEYSHPSLAWAQSLGHGIQASGTKTTGLQVRPIRAF